MGIIHSKNYSITKKLFNKIFIQKIWKLFIQKNYSFFWKIDYRPGLRLMYLHLWFHLQRSKLIVNILIWQNPLLTGYNYGTENWSVSLLENDKICIILPSLWVILVYTRIAFLNIIRELRISPYLLGGKWDSNSRRL